MSCQASLAKEGRAAVAKGNSQLRIRTGSAFDIVLIKVLLGFFKADQVGDEGMRRKRRKKRRRRGRRGRKGDFLAAKRAGGR